MLSMPLNNIQETSFKAFAAIDIINRKHPEAIPIDNIQEILAVGRTSWVMLMPAVL